MAKHTAQSIIMASPRFVELATEDALKLIAKTNCQSYSLARKAFQQRAENVVSQVVELVYLAAEKFAENLNAEAAR